MKINPENAGWAIIGALVGGGVLAYVAYQTMQPDTTTPIGDGGGGEPPVPPPGSSCGTWGPLYHDGNLSGIWVDDGNNGCKPQCQPGYQLGADGKSCVPQEGGLAVNCAAKAADATAPYGWVDDGNGGCQPAPVPAEDVNCSDRQIWTGTECETPPWNLMAEPPPAPVAVWMPPQNANEFQLTPQDGQTLDVLGYKSDSDGVYAFSQDFNLINSLLEEQGSLQMNGYLTEDGIIRNEVRGGMGWALAYETSSQETWPALVARAEGLVA